MATNEKKKKGFNCANNNTNNNNNNNNNNKWEEINFYHLLNVPFLFPLTKSACAVSLAATPSNFQLSDF
jgi:hypothetical protein